MPRAEIYIEDAEQGAAVRFAFQGGYNKASPAHQLANIVRSKLDEMASAGELTALPTDERQGKLELVGRDE